MLGMSFSQAQRAKLCTLNTYSYALNADQNSTSAVKA